MVEFNTELFGKIHKAITAEDDATVGFAMHSWESVEWRPRGEAMCATTRCVAGWAISLHTGAPLFGGRDEYGRKLVSGSVKELARSLGAERSLVDSNDFAMIGAALLGLTDQERALFYASEEDAAEVVKLIAEGKHDAARERLAEIIDAGDDHSGGDEGYDD